MCATSRTRTPRRNRTTSRRCCGELGIDASDEPRLIEVWNKIDRLDAEARARLLNLAERQPAERAAGAGSALTGEGIDALDRGDRGAAWRRAARCSISSLDPADGAGVSWLTATPKCSRRSCGDDGRLAMTVRADPAKAARVRAKFGAGRAEAR